MNSDRIENVVIIGSGPSGYTAALYTARADLEPLVIEGFAWGGLLQETTSPRDHGSGDDAAASRPMRTLRSAPSDGRGHSGQAV
ncbi:MAG: hypothetical protein NTX07_01030 [Solirubrobacterales bacterium]|nr:hypothetical protein [Solirubrobacterales bacterium]